MTAIAVSVPVNLSLRSALRASQAALAKVGNPYHDPQSGEFTSGPGGGGGPRGDGTPYSGKIAVKNTELQNALREHNMYLRSGDTNSSEAVAARQHVETIQTQLRSLRAQRTAAMLQQTKTSTQHDTGGAPYGSSRPANLFDPAAARAAQENRARQANHLAQQGQERRRAEGLLAEIENNGGTASPYQVRGSNYVPVSESRVPGSAEGLRQALVDTTARVSRAAQAVGIIATNLHGATATTDYSRIGTHLNQIRSNITQLNHELKGLPADSRVLAREAGISLSRAKAAVDRMTRAIKTKVTGSGKKKKY